MNADFKQVGDTLVVRITGELDMLVTDQLRQAIDQRLDTAGIRTLVLNLEKVTFIDSSGLGVIIGRYKKVRAQQGRMYIVGASPSVEKILHFSGINKLVPLYRSEKDVVSN
ncbi:MAG TPA: anti-sigma F factor antagonist [Syntrophomonadaceae bacterium]|nr:anti-sigma F factor antagonist [Syntrophomonadaceae bacterium]HOQ09115.1 anti-sigma F factor antagonist [Syntrophomonadaceae bacterium]HPU48913.1 anti-sigma F factor antagonist [Syntrophomonadaceae bacterium]